MTEHLTAGEWDRWRDDDRAFKAQVTELLLDHTERLTRVETNAGRAESAAVSAESAKKWSMVSNIIGVVINAGMVAFGFKPGG